ncbi:survival motor neuron protein [Drosophila tropicalis]|uniref:survival motor neuron protein n=1 Tax=Drosophila tropicalis TaxID=46794 RepID=UPI0035ABD791
MSDEANTLAWDDTLLMKTYDESVDLAREALARRLADYTNKQEAAEAASGVADNKTESATNASVSPEAVFKVGDFARATYTDGLDYEGSIVSINEDTGTCMLRYCGYENDQEVLLTDLLPSWGKKTRRDQFLQAKAELEQEQSRPKNVAKKPTKKTGNPGLVVPPMPFVPPIITPTGDTIDGEQDFVAMLTAWYMSGYYTGFYQGKKDANKKNQSESGAADSKK